MYLADPDKVLEVIGFESMTDIVAAIAEALDSAEQLLASRLTSEFAQATYTDLFYVDEPPYTQGGSNQTEFRLRSGLVQSLTSVSSVYGLDAWGTGDELNYTDKLNSTLLLDKDRGVLRDVYTAYNRNWVKVTYVAGFPVSGSNPKMYDLTVVPKWLQDAAVAQAKTLLADHPAVTEAQVKIDGRTQMALVNTMVARKVRYAPAALLPL